MVLLHVHGGNIYLDVQCLEHDVLCPHVDLSMRLTDSFAKITAMARQNQLNALSSYLEAIDSIKWNQIGPAYSALDNVGFGETVGEGIEDDAE